MTDDRAQTTLPAPRVAHRRPTPRRALLTAAIAFAAGAICAFPLYGIYPWWDTVTHYIGGAALAAVVGLRYRGVAIPILAVVALAVGWELFEQLVPAAWLTLGWVTADWRLDLVVSIAGGVVGAVLAAWDVGMGR